MPRTALTVALVAVACRAAQPAAPPATPPRPAAPAAPSAVSRAPLSEEAATRRVTALPEVAAYQRAVEGRGRALAIRAESEPAQGCAQGAGDCAWELNVGEDAGERVGTWARFRVDARSGEVGVVDPVSAEVLTLERWRAGLPPEFTAGLYEPEFGHGNFHRHRSYLFFPDGRFEYRADGYERLPDLPCGLEGPVARGGTWRLENNALALTTTWESRARGGRQTRDAAEGCYRRNVTVARADLPSPRAESLPVGRCAEADRVDSAECVTLGGARWYRMAGADRDPRAAWYAWCDEIPESDRPPVCRDRR